MIDSLYIAQSGLNTSKYSVDVTSNNIANENTEGYIKRVVNTSELSSLEDDIGNGVSFDGVYRTTSVYLYDKLLSQSSMASYYEQENSILSNLEIMFSETETSGLSTTLSSFFNSIESLRTDSSNLIYQNELSTQAQNLVDGLQSLNEDIEDSFQTAIEQLQDQVESVNNLLEQIGSFMGSKIVDAAAVASAIVILRSGVRDPKIIGGAFALYAVAKKDGQLMGQLAGKSFDLYLKDTFNVDVDQFINKNINQVNQIIDTYFDISERYQPNTSSTIQTTTTIYDVAAQLNTSVSKLEQSNPWLKSRSSDNLSTIFNNSSNKSLLVQDNTGKSYTYTYNSSSDTFENQTPIATADDAINFIANYQGSMSNLQDIQTAVKDAYENYGLSKEYYDAFNSSFSTYVMANTQSSTVTTPPT